MRDLTPAELERQDYVDNEIYRLVVALAPKEATIPWNIEMIGDIRDELEAWVVSKLALCGEHAFYPYVSE
ncbi:MAG: hypothetical protein QME66_10025 [Candidatus Eisenbacteria bacterium]|nr:hypothetical protein [Candidatus Eisenbacteria bacterium]